MPDFATTDSAIGLDEETNQSHVARDLGAGALLATLGARSHSSTQSACRLFSRESLYAEFAPLVRRLLRQYGTDPELRKDLAGEIYCRFCALVEAYDPGRGVPLRPYLVRQLTASTYTYVRSQWNLQKREAFIDFAAPSGPAEPSYDPTPSWLSALSRQQVVRALPEAIAQLPERQRKVVCWRYYDELPFEEIARILEVEQATVRSLLRHGIANLRKQMQSSPAAAA